MRHWVVILLIVAAGCGTIRGTFGAAKPDYSEVPTDALRQTARAIETAIAAEERSPDIAAQQAVSVDSETIRQAIRSRAARFPLVDEFRNSGHAVEKPDGLIWIERTREYRKSGNSRDRDRDALLVNGENENRWQIYEGLIKANNWSPRALGAIQRIFYEERLATMSPGQRYEQPDGTMATVGR